MIRITLPDGACREYDQPLSVFEVAASIGSGLAKAAVAGRVDGRLVDCDYLLDTDSRLSIVTATDADGLEVLRHSCAHLLAMAVKQLYPSAQVTIGPVIEDGFFYDFAYERPFTPEDLELIEARMHSLAATNHTLRRRELSREQALQHFADNRCAEAGSAAAAAGTSAAVAWRVTEKAQRSAPIGSAWRRAWACSTATSSWPAATGFSSCPWPCWSAVPNTTSSTSPGSIPARSTAALIASLV